MIFALIGNQNCGKTTLFNQLTGANQHVGNFPGVTVDQKVGEIKEHKNCSVVDLPGIYSLRPYTSEEIVTRDFLINEKPDAIINIVDATNIERNLYLTLQLLEKQIPMVLALNMMDEVRYNGGSIDVMGMSGICQRIVVHNYLLHPAYHTNLHYIRLHIVHDSLYLPRNNLGRNIEELLNTERILHSDAGYRRNSITAQLGNRPDVRLHTRASGAV